MAEARPAWRAIHDRLAQRDLSSLSAGELDELAESLFWLDRPDDSIAVLGKAFQAHVAAGDQEGAVMAAWQLFYDHALVGETALANGWLERARRRADHVKGSAAGGFLAVAEADRAEWTGELDRAVAHARRAVELGRATGDANLLAMALQAQGRSLVGSGRLDEGFSALDEAMVAVVNGELAPLFAGWVYCNALSTCHDLADLARAAQWSDAAMRWCDDLEDGRFYPGTCRLHVVELETLRGRWETAVAAAEQACGELASHDPRYAGEAHYLMGELHRRTGDIDLAEEAFTRAHQLGRVPQPGLARVRMAQGRLGAAAKGLWLALDAVPVAPRVRIELLAALADHQLAVDDIDGAVDVAAEMSDVAREAMSDYLQALALMAEAQVLLAQGEGAAACRCAGETAQQMQLLGLPYDWARARMVRGRAAELIGERDTARMELVAARETFRALGAEPEERHVDALLGDAPPSPLSAREVEVLRLVARGDSNKKIAAELCVSEHTVARHLSNIYTKLGVGSRSAATAFAYEHALI
jgi:ATP/maltotriose-dependent transcriptional regulator MalT